MEFRHWRCALKVVKPGLSQNRGSGVCQSTGSLAEGDPDVQEGQGPTNWTNLENTAVTECLGSGSLEAETEGRFVFKSFVKSVPLEAACEDVRKAGESKGRSKQRCRFQLKCSLRLMSGFPRLCHLKPGGQAFSLLRWAVIGCGLLLLLGWEGEGSETTGAFVAPSLPPPA